MPMFVSLIHINYLKCSIQLQLEIIEKGQVQWLSNDIFLSLFQNQSTAVVGSFESLEKLGRDVVVIMLGSANVKLLTTVGRWVMVRCVLLELFTGLWKMCWVLQVLWGCVHAWCCGHQRR